MQQLSGRVSGFVARLSDRSRIAIAAGVLAIVALTVGTVAYLHDGGAPLFARPLDSAQISEVAERLTEWDIPFRPLIDNVEIAPAQKHDVLLRLAMLGLPHAHMTTSSDVLKTVNALTPQTVLDAQLREGLEGDLAEGLRGITGIADARVLIAPATRGFFVDEPSHDASASVRVTLADGATLAPAAVAGIRSYVASAVAGLAADHVAVVDQNGAALTAKPAGAADGSEDTALESTLQGALDRTLGTGRAIVIARVESDPSSSRVHEVRRTPVVSAAVGSDLVREHYRGKDKQYDKLHQTTDRGSDTVERDTIVAAGRTTRRSVAVFVDARLGPVVAQVRSIVAVAAGLVPARGDALAVVPMAFASNASAVVASTRPAFALASLPPSLAIGLLIAGLLGAGAFLWRGITPGLRVESTRAAFTQHLASVPTTEHDPARIHAAIAAEPPHAAAAILATLPAATAAVVLEMYDADARRAIVARLGNPLPPLVRDVSARVSGV